MPEGEHTNRDLSILTKLAQQGKVFSDTLFKMYARELFKAGHNTAAYKKANLTFKCP